MKNKIKIAAALIITCSLGVPLSVYGYSYHSYKTNLKGAENLLSKEQYDSSIKAFKNLKSSRFYSSDSSLINYEISLASTLKQSKKDFNSALTLFNKKQYLDATYIFKKVKKCDKKRYSISQAEIVTANKLYITDTIEKAKNEASNKKYDTAINFLDSALKIDKNNNEALNLKTTYTKELQALNTPVETKETTPLVAQNQPIKTSNGTSQNNSSQTTTSSVNPPKPSATAPSATNSNAPNYTVSFSNGWFSVQLNSGSPTPAGFGIRSMTYAGSPNGIYYDFVGSESAQYTMTLHLPTGDVQESGSTSDGTHLIPVSPASVPSGQAINIDISATYKGKNYTGSFSRVFNSN
ncbi:hypothetical protein KYB31_00725 [Clostridium felsineum]|uniref:hypothetical protein n=1 Tax=Clostridium felsineum TaxID=36839 RepID=UPI00214D8B78|nr:hypothetical protein [Clostridium felsineum]MCR3757513.1 hypothetical protein [Clostridium felsineum]